ncbi:unnamed protein product [Prorocentrum cordatum]|uniref:Ricin B lectin domain-containing protein n=1 Tax=Prorocentrum cordatum TaxID=2364126 RepID=A0ABN9WKU6_9DINO|nr:unnamed protein product [Polarella glacialis]
MRVGSGVRWRIWTCVGWAGTHRLAVMWTGDDSGSFDYIRWQIPTYVGTGFSAQAHVSGDIDGIFGGSPETYVRDLQFKCFMTSVMVMSGWAGNPDKQPWTWGEPYTSINRRYLKLKQALTPYFYSLSRIAHNTGLPPVRAMALEFPSDDSVMASHTGSSQQFMAGPSFLVAPVYRPLAEAAVREGIYLPAGDWVDYWSGSVLAGGRSLPAVPVALEDIPVFVRAGAIVPMWTSARGSSGQLALDIYPEGDSSFDLYEDDGVTRKAIDGRAFSWTRISCQAPPQALRRGGDIVVAVSASVGSFEGQPAARGYLLQAHMPKPPYSVLLWRDGKNYTLRAMSSSSALDFSESGWFFSQAVAGGIAYIKTPSLPTADPWSLQISTRSKYPHVFFRQCDGTSAQSFMFDPTSGYIKLNSDQSSCLTIGTDKDFQSGTPAVEMQPCSGQKWQLDLSTGNLHPASDLSKCIDVDAADHAAEIYQCGHLQGNQRFNFTYDGSGVGHHSGTFRRVDDGTCMTAVNNPAGGHGAGLAQGLPLWI